MNSTSTPAPEARYPSWLGVTSFSWAIVGWILAASAPRLAFVPGVEVLHLVLPSVTVLLILGNLGFSLHALFRRKVPIDRLLLVTGLQIGLFTTLFFQFAAHIGAECYEIQHPTHSWEWVQFSFAHAVRASDVWDTLEAFGWSIQAFKHRSPFVGAFVVAYHVVIDLFVLGLFWALFKRIKKRLLENPKHMALLRTFGIFMFLLWLGVWLLFALRIRPWRAIDIPLWFVENTVHVIDFADAMVSFDIHWHQIPKEPLESTLTFLCRFWIAFACSLLLNWWTARKGPTAVGQVVLPSLGQSQRLGIALVLPAALVVADALVTTGNSG